MIDISFCVMIVSVSFDFLGDVSELIAVNVHIGNNVSFYFIEKYLDYKMILLY